MQSKNSLDNLKKGDAYKFKSGDEAPRKNGRKGGIKSQKVQKEKRDAAALMMTMLDLKPNMPPQVEKYVREMGIKTKKPDALTLMTVAVVRSAMAGDLKAYEKVLELIGQKPGAQPSFSQQEGDGVDIKDEQSIRETLDEMTDDQLRSYQEICGLFSEPGELEDDQNE